MVAKFDTHVQLLQDAKTGWAELPWGATILSPTSSLILESEASNMAGLGASNRKHRMGDCGLWRENPTIYIWHINNLELLAIFLDLYKRSKQLHHSLQVAGLGATQILWNLVLEIWMHGLRNNGSEQSISANVMAGQKLRLWLNVESSKLYNSSWDLSN